jgi:hypothetical protein
MSICSKSGDRCQELPRLRLGAEAHHRLDPGAVVPAAIEKHHLACAREIPDIALEIPGVPLAIGRRPQGHDAGLARAQMLDDMLDGPVLAGGVTPLDDHEDALAIGDHLPL